MPVVWGSTSEVAKSNDALDAVPTESVAAELYAVPILSETETNFAFAGIEATLDAVDVPISNSSIVRLVEVKVEGLTLAQFVPLY